MSRDLEHVDFDQMSDWIDGNLDSRSAAALEEHMSTCSVCSNQQIELRKLLEASKLLPKSVLPPDDLWPDLKQALNARKDLVLPTVGLPASQPARGVTTQPMSWRTRTFLAIAALILIVVSSAVTTLVLRRSDQQIARQFPNGRRATNAPNDPAIVLPASFVQAEAEYRRTIDELRLAVDTQRSQLSPETVRTVDHSLAVVDSAIAEARAALIADPNNRMLIDLLSASYQRKLDLLRRTSELSSRI